MQSGMTHKHVGAPRRALMTVGKIAKVYPEANMVDVFLLDGTLLSKVQILSKSSSRTGTVEIPIPSYLKPFTEAPENIGQYCSPEESDVYVVIAFMENNINKPVVLGFLFPEENELLCSQKQDGNSDGSMFLWKHKSNVYARVDENGDTELSHPSGVLIKIGKNTERTEILNYDRKVRPFKWKKRQTEELAPAPWVTLQHPSGNSVTIDPQGNVTENIVGNLTRTVKGNLIEIVEGKAQRTVSGDISESSGGKFSREARASISDTAPRIDHN